MNNNNNYLSDQVQRTLKVIIIMAGNEVTGISPGELAKQADTTPANITRCLSNLEHQNFAERLPNDKTKWRLGASLVQISNTVSISLHRAEQQLQQDQHNYSRIA